MLRAVAGMAPTGVVLIDGPSSARTSTLADALVRDWPGALRPTLVRFDDVYPGWGGLEAAVEQISTRVFQPRRKGRPAAWQCYDWVEGRPGGVEQNRAGASVDHRGLRRDAGD